MLSEIKRMLFPTAVEFATAACMWAQAGSVSVPCVIDGFTSSTIHWETSFTNAIPICWNWCTGATRAELTMTDLNTSPTSAAFASSEGDGALMLPAITNNEDWLNLTLSFFSDDDTEMLVLSGRVARVFNGTSSAVRIDGIPVSSAEADTVSEWSSVPRPGATTPDTVIPYDSSWTFPTQAVSSAVWALLEKKTGKAVTADLPAVSGYFGWKLSHSEYGYGWYTLSTFYDSQTAETANVFRLGAGTLYRFQ